MFRRETRGFRRSPEQVNTPTSTDNPSRARQTKIILLIISTEHTSVLIGNYGATTLALFFAVAQITRLYRFETANLYLRSPCCTAPQLFILELVNNFVKDIETPS